MERTLASMEYIQFSIVKAKILPMLMWQLHGFFSKQAKSGDNQFGLLFNPVCLGVVKQFRVFHPTDVSALFKQPAILKHVNDNAIKIKFGQINADVEHIEVVAQMRDRRYEKQSPGKAMKRFESSNMDGDAMVRFKEKVQAYLATTPLHYPIKTSRGQQFSIFLKHERKIISREDFNKQAFCFSGYGLSVENSKIYLPLSDWSEGEVCL